MSEYNCGNCGNESCLSNAQDASCLHYIPKTITSHDTLKTGYDASQPNAARKPYEERP